MTDEHKPVPHAAPKPMAKKAKPKPKAPLHPKPAPRAPIPSAPVPVAPSKGRIAAAVGVTLAAGVLIGRAVFGVAGKMLRRGR